MGEVVTPEREAEVREDPTAGVEELQLLLKLFLLRNDLECAFKRSRLHCGDGSELWRIESDAVLSKNNSVAKSSIPVPEGRTHFRWCSISLKTTWKMHLRTPVPSC